MADVAACMKKAEEAEEKIARLKETVKEISALLAETSSSAPSQDEGPALQKAVEGHKLLEEQNAKMAYRIKHLLRAIDPSFAASVEASSAPVDLSVRKGSCLAGTVWK
ncbi:hypothetical protein GUITHDRAFT_163162 [Guillardia theta CCMP2712]|uniref:Uncharacterized protein n=1 Tax=Guillardia theta (strain CCMP2712) TaxID=905079 RepID=L1JBH2_GUITC|nr:hypothetical protein GUITHDRAFT_163162 [Guillardia theta CCMP2712]EKX45883.1 hypothetical protein GUITHDRAFT_163162 [Guillardia theta CCMP2712]|eukprot:XP_005832863.1 hypothetical protein GUITHDRAFT_163162 [Guillardia theta CCMP2712]